ncbi:MAG TPA: LamG domain-containing protein [Clostridia bacterium]|nr:LamG domain-containing protein [Clostridia bacterium]
MESVGPFRAAIHPLALKPRGRKPPALGPKVRVEAVRASPASDPEMLPLLAQGLGLMDRDKDGLLEHGVSPAGMWLGTWTPELRLEFELPQEVALSSIEVWNFNAPWQTTNGIRKADISVSSDGAQWQTVLTGAEFREAEGTLDYDEPTVLKLGGVKAKRVRFENIMPLGKTAQVGLSEVVFHEALSAQAGTVQPEDGALGIPMEKVMLRWAPGENAKEHKVYCGTDPADLKPLGTTQDTSLEIPSCASMSAYFWRVDEVQPDGKIVTGRTAKFETAGLVGWWKLDETAGLQAADASGHCSSARVNGPPTWVVKQGKRNGALEFNGVDNFVDCGNHARFSFREAMTLAAWVKVRQFDKTHQTIAAKGSSQWPGSGAWRLERYQDSDTVGFTIDGVSTERLAGADWTRLTSTHGINDDQWHHLVGVYDGQRMALYLDGKLEASAKVTGRMAYNEAPVFIGENPIRPGRQFNGWIDDVRLYSRGLTEAEIQELYRNESGPADKK